MQAYSEMIDSELAYLGMIPRSWRLTPASMLFNENRQNNQSLISQTPLQFKMGNIIRKNVDVDDKLREEIKRYTVVDKNDIMVNGLNLNYDFATQRVALVGERGCITPAYIALRTRKNYLPRYANYLLKALDGQKVLNGWGTGIRLTLNFTEFKKYRLPEPNTETQEKIADFLDTETAQIDNLIAKQERLLELLEEKRRATITHAVTRGLDPNVELKETNIPWLGQVPTHWKLKKLKHIGQSIIGLTYSPSDLSGTGTMVLRSMNIAGGKINTDTQLFVSKAIPQKLLTKENDLLICSRNGSRRLIGKCGLIQKSQEGHTFGVFNTVFRSDYNDYVYYILNSNIFFAQLGLFMTSTINQLTVNTLNNFEIALPPNSDRVEIVSYLNDEEVRFTELKQKIQTQIALLRERRTSLISHAVTGKIKV